MEEQLILYDLKNNWMNLTGMLLGIIVIAITGIVDDIKTIKPLTKLMGQFIAATIVAGFGLRLENFLFLPTTELNEIFSIIITIVWIIGITNAINLIDGLDGLSSGITVISAVSLLVIFVLNGSSMVSIILITALAGALVRIFTI